MTTTHRHSALPLRLAMLGILAMYALMAARFRFTVDAAWIDVRFAQNLAAGEGLRFNIGAPPLEAFNPLMVALGAMAQALGLPAMPVLQLVGLLSGGALLVWLYDGLTKRLSVHPAVALGAVGTLSLSPMVGAWASGLPESLLGLLLLWGTFDRWVLARAPLQGAGLAAVLLIARPDGPAWVGALLAVTLLWHAAEHRQSQRPLPVAARAPHRWLKAFAAASVGLLALLAALTAARMALFDSPIPWTVARWRPEPGAGLNYLLASSFGVGVPVIWAVAAGFPGARSREAMPLVAATAFALVGTVIGGGESAPFGRLLLPAAPFATALLALAADQQLRQQRSGTALWLLLFAGIFAHLPAWDVPLAPKRLRQATDLRPDKARTRTEIAEWRFTRSNSEQAAALARAVAQAVPADASWTAGSPGIRAVYSGLVIHDLSGRTDPSAHAARVGDLAPRDFFEPQRPTVLRARRIDTRSTAAVLKADWDATQPQYRARILPQPSGDFLVLQERQ